MMILMVGIIIIHDDDDAHNYDEHDDHYRGSAYHYGGHAHTQAGAVMVSANVHQNPHSQTSSMRVNRSHPLVIAERKVVDDGL